jgi:hypothetical protein
MPGWHLFAALRGLTWRVSPVGARVLSARGTAYGTAWSVNRTETVHLLRAAGEFEVARSYAAYYEHAWAFYLSGWRDANAGRSAFAAAIRAIEAGRDVGRRVLEGAQYR